MALHYLRQRRLLAAATHDSIDRSLQALLSMNQSLSQPVSVYLGFDPTADSLHVGHLSGIMALKVFQQHGVRPIALIGGATGAIGDPSGKDKERPLLNAEEISQNAKGIERCLRKILHFSNQTASISDGLPSAILVNNIDWYKECNIVDFLRNVGKNFRVGTLLSRDSVRNRLGSEGLSFTEFTYQVLQGYDFLHLYESYNCRVQLGGSDQWGNILGGCELIKRVYNGADAFGVTFPLLTSTSGEKFGKSAGNALWLDHQKTSVFDFYQFFLRVDDRDVEDMLYKLTDITTEDIGEVIRSHQVNPEKRMAQGILAENVTRRIHGKDSLSKALKATNLLYGQDNSTKACGEDILAIIETGNIPAVKLRKEEIIGQTVQTVMVLAQVCKSKAECKRLINSGGLYLNNDRVTDASEIMSPEKGNIIEYRYILVRRGQKHYTIISLE